MARSSDPSKEQLRTDEILDAAMRQFAAEGFDGTKLAHVARRAGVAVGTIYLRYPGKAELLGAVLSRLEDAFCAAMDDEDIWATPFPARFDPIMTRVMTLAANEETLGSLMALTPYATFTTGRAGDKVRAKIAEHLSEGMAAGQLRSDIAAHDAAILAHGMVEAAMIDHMIRRARPPEAAAKELADVSRRWLCP